MRLFDFSRFLLGAIVLLQTTGYAKEVGSNNGAFILISSSGDVQYLQNNGQEGPAIQVGEIIPTSYTIRTGVNGKLVGLLSNGTLLTLTENTRMKVASFEQEPFVDDGRKLAELPGEPSASEVLIDLDYGSLVVKTKKLNKTSSFNIDSPVGVAGIRGTEFQMAAKPDQGVQLDVTESTVAFTPPGGGDAIPVSQGNGLSVSPSGVATQRPLNPVVATKIETTNQAASEATQDVSLGEVARAVEQSSVIEKQVTRENEEASESNDGEIEEDETSEESAIKGNENTVETQELPKEDEGSKKSSAEEEGSTPGNAEDSKPQDGSDPQGGESSSVGTGKDSKSATPEEVPPPKKSQETVQPATRKTGALKSKVQQPDKSLLLENNSELKKNQKLARYGLSKEQVARYDRLSAEARLAILNEPPNSVIRLLGISGFNAGKADIFFSHDRETRELFMTVTDDVLLAMLDPTVDKVLLKESLYKLKFNAVQPGKAPVIEQNEVLNARAIALGDRLKESENTQLMEELLEMSGGTLNEYWIRIGEVAEVLTHNLEVSDFSALPGFSAQEVWENPFFLELANAYEQLEIDGLVNGADRVLGADHLIVEENAVAFGSHFSNGVEEVVLLSRKSMTFRGDFNWDSTTNEGTRLVVMTAGDLEISKGASLHSATSDLVIAARQDLLLEEVNLAAREVAIRGMRDVTLNEVKIDASMLATIKARRDLNVNGLEFKKDISRIVMEAQTMRLRNVNFPGAAQVRLNSLKGAIDGRYPNFGNVSAAQQIGRVNFIENVRSAGNLLKDRPSFDQHGQNIKIGKIARP